MVPVQKNQVAVSPKRDVVKSTAVVEWSATRCPVQFSQLSLNTNLNDAPANWLRSQSTVEQHLRDLPWQKDRSEFSSFAMANLYPDYAGVVDVVSDAENIKTLLKMPFLRDSHASLMVHRVGCTLLLDEFDVHKHLLRQESENWTWLRQFFQNTVMKNEDLKCIPRKSRKQDVLQNRIMFSKFLYHSLAGSSCQELELSQAERGHQVSPVPGNQLQHFVADQMPNTEKLGGKEFHRQTLWTFEDLRMLIGADLPIFSVGDHPCVSLRLQDASQPINVVTGLDYWLDNLMCNVPEVAMCYHDSGFVQKYELIKTEDIPKLEGSKFDPQLVKDIACNILSFLRNSATREGHTYWLYKCKRSDTVKLYDLTMLCDNSVPQGGATPFTVPVGMLLYRVARRMRQSSDHFKTPEIKALLQNSLRLLDETEHAQVCTSSYYLLSDLYLPDSCIHDKWVDEPPDDLSEQSSESDEESEAECQAEMSVQVKELFQRHDVNKTPHKRVRLEGITGTPDERCQDGLQYLRKGLTCLERDLQAKLMQGRRSTSSIVEEQQTCNANEAIPLKYEPIHQAGNPAAESSSLQLSTHAASHGTWHQLSKALLLRKACMANYVLAKEFLSNKQYGYSLKHVRYAIHCFESMARLIPSKEKENRELLMLILLKAAEAHHFLSLGQNSFEEHQRGFDDMSEEDAYILDRAQSVLLVPSLAWAYRWTTSRYDNLRDSLRCLEHIRTLAMMDPANHRELLLDVNKKMCEECNELGKLAMAQAEAMLTNGATFASMEEYWWTESKELFEKGLEGFREVGDVKNEAIILLNMARLHRVAARALTNVMENTTLQFSEEERHHYKMAFQCFERALECFGSSAEYRRCRDCVLWDYSTAYMQMGMLLQDYPPYSTMEKSDIAREIARVFQKAIKLCGEISSESEKKESEGRSKRLFGLAEASFKSAVDTFASSESWCDMLKSQIKRIGLHRCCYDSSGKNAKAKDSILQTLLMLLLDCEMPLGMLSESKVMGTDCEIGGLGDWVEFLLKQTCYTLLHVLQRLATNKKRSKDRSEEQEVLKSLYNSSLRLSKEHYTLKDVPSVKKLMQEIRIQYVSRFC
ncbi:hypothetical protein BaRGS_00010404, partial [Batillaria attramentaria]